MKKLLFLGFLFFLYHFSMACEVCEKNQPKITRGITHGSGPQSNWDWVIITIMVLITLLTLAYSIKYLVKPGEKNSDHIKKTILSNENNGNCK